MGRGRHDDEFGFDEEWWEFQLGITPAVGGATLGEAGLPLKVPVSPRKKRGRGELNADDEPPTFVHAVPRLLGQRGDIEALKALTSFESPPRRVVRSSNLIKVVYGFGDASGKGWFVDSTTRRSNLLEEWLVEWDDRRRVV
jgi:hypothetical protein